MNINKVKLLPAREQVASVLRKAILSRELQEGQEITLEEIAGEVGVSVTPVREAFQILSSDGLIKLRPNKGAVVLGVNEKTIKDHYETRAVLEGEAAARASAVGVDLSEVETAYQISERALEENNSSEYSRYNQLFHMGIWEAADNSKMKSLLSSMWNGLSMGHKVTEEDYAKISIYEHKRILDAIKAHDSERARKNMQQHIIRSMNNILTRFERYENINNKEDEI
ncbi:GntR family transcriptional regulator [Lacrimispora sp. 38-1]|uniref:GntR family transcriptional regulator n=1 Tax=Lacrimispora sp. 38-1 TaxID=3125778 RepID=UPI003CFBA0DE